MPAIRLATIDAAGAVARLMTGLNRTVGTVYGVPNTPDRQLVTLDQARARMNAMLGIEQVLLAEDDSESVGLLSLRMMPYLSEDAPYAEIAELYVEPPHRRTGMGRQLVEEAERIARSQDCTTVHVNAWRDNRTAQQFYAAMGYEAAELAYEKVLVTGSR